MEWRFIRHALFAWILFPSLSTCVLMSDLFSVDASCNDKGVDAMLSEALTLLSTARAATDLVKSAKSFNPLTNKKERQAMKNAHEMFGIALYDKWLSLGLNAEDQERLNTVNANLQTLIDLLSGQTVARPGLSGQTVQLKPANAYLTCDDSVYRKTTRARDIDPAQEEGKTTAQAFLAQSLFFIDDNQFLNAAGVKRRVIRPSLDSPDRICTEGLDGILALTHTQTSFTANEPMLQMVICAKIFDESQFLKSINDRVPKSTDAIANFKYRASAFVHESCHILGETFNDQRFTRLGQPARWLSPYGPYNIAALAARPQDFGNQYGGAQLDTAFLPDAYRIYTQMSLFLGTKWTYGPGTL